MVQARVKNWSKYVAQQNWTSFNARIGSFVVKKSSSFCRENEIFNNKKLDQFKTRKKRQKLDQILTLHHIYIYILDIEMLTWPPLQILAVIFLQILGGENF